MRCFPAADCWRSAFSPRSGIASRWDLLLSGRRTPQSTWRNDMTHREARRGAAVAGAILFAMPVAEVMVGLGSPGPVHFIVGTLGVGMIVAALSGRFL